MSCSRLTLSLCHLSESVGMCWIHLALSPICLLLALLLLLPPSCLCATTPPPLSFCLSVQITRVVPQNCLKQTLLLYFMAKRLLDLRHKGTETCTDCSVQPVTFGVQSQPSSLKLQRLCTHTYTCVRTKQHIFPAPLFSNQAYFLSSLLPIN